MILEKITNAIRGNDDFISEINEGDHVYRARSFFQEKKYCARNLAHPVGEDLKSSTRMSPLGIPAFYASTEKRTAIAEIKKGGNQCIVGQWVLGKDIKVIDFTKSKSEEIDFFDIKNQKRIDEISFFKEFSSKISNTIEKDGREHIEYIPTQALSEFIKISFEDICGIIYKSNNGIGENVCLFPERVNFCDDFSRGEKTECKLISHEII